MTRVVLALAIAGLAAPVRDLRAAAPANDNFAGRTLIVGTDLTVTGSNLEATKEPGEPTHAANSGGKSVWWSWTAPGNGDVTITTDDSSFDTLLAVYIGSTVSALNVVATNDDHGLLVSSRVRFSAAQGTEYQIAVDGFNSETNVDSGSITLSLAFISEPILRPPNDNFSSRIPLSGASVTTNASNAEATREAGEPFHAEELGDTSVWWTWTAPAPGAVRITTEGTGFDTLLAVYSGSSLLSLTEIASNDDADPASGVLTSALTFETAAGETFEIAVDGFDGQSGVISLHIESAPISLSGPVRRSDGSFQFTLNGVAAPYQIDASADFLGWTVVTNVINTNGVVVVVDPAATNHAHRFYRAQIQP